ncbi:MAG: hypothetical protein ACREJT_02200 [Myxococcota bacterium]
MRRSAVASPLAAALLLAGAVSAQVLAPGDSSRSIVVGATTGRADGNPL